MTEVADQVRDGMLVSGATVLLKNRDCLGSPCNVMRYVRRDSPGSFATLAAIRSNLVEIQVLGL